MKNKAQNKNLIFSFAEKESFSLLQVAQFRSLIHETYQSVGPINITHFTQQTGKPLFARHYFLFLPKRRTTISGSHSQHTSRTLAKSIMASSKVEMEKNDGELKYLGFVRMISINIMMCLLNLYECAKQKSGPLKSTLQTMENAVTAAIGPVYEKYKGVPDVAVGFLDKKLVKAVSDLDELAPPLAKSVVRITKQVVYKAANIFQEMVQEVRVAGPRSAILYFATLCKNFVEGYMPILIGQVTRFPVIHSVAKEFIPTATVWVGKYNNLVTKLGARGYHLFRYFPLVPMDDIAKAFKND